MTARPDMNRIDQRFAELSAAGKKAFVAYICAGDPGLEVTRDIVLALEKAGADIIELGLPFSDPLADGIVNQMAADRALRAGATTAKVLEMIAALRRETQIPLVLFTYLNPVYTYGFERFHKDAAAAGADGILVLDLPHDEAALNKELCGSTSLKHIRLVAPTTPPDRVKLIAGQSEGFVYYVSRAGVTGAQTSLAGGIGRAGEIDQGGSTLCRWPWDSASPPAAGALRGWHGRWRRGRQRHCQPDRETWGGEWAGPGVGGFCQTACGGGQVSLSSVPTRNRHDPEFLQNERCGQ